MLPFLLATALQTATYTDDLDRQSLLAAIDYQLRDLQTQPAAVVRFADEQVSTGDLQRTLRIFRTVVVRYHGTRQFNSEVSRRFRVLTTVGQTLFTAYYVPSIQASLVPHGAYRYPFYAYPVGGTALTRGEIDGGALAGKGLELAWVKDPFARYALMIEGSGLLNLENGTVKHLNYAGNNGQAYKGVEEIFQDWHRTTGNPLAWSAITGYFGPRLIELWPYLARNPRYIFFKLSDEGPYGLSRIPLTAGRSIATDKRLYPAGGLAFIDVEGSTIRRFVIDQDKGAAITGQRHVDLFAGGGEAGLKLGTHLLHRGRLSYLLARPDVPPPMDPPASAPSSPLYTAPE